ncbi:UNVERIFIED_CONTAM: hypothetical protein Cloal_0691 [Acetivibrio alkalicellulosi]
MITCTGRTGGFTTYGEQTIYKILRAILITAKRMGIYRKFEIVEVDRNNIPSGKQIIEVVN